LAMDRNPARKREACVVGYFELPERFGARDG
jgi:hypothetical protein